MGPAPMDIAMDIGAGPPSCRVSAAGCHSVGVQ